MNYLITGTSGFIGFHLAKSLLKDGNNVTGIDNNNDYYDKKLKADRLHILESNYKKNFNFHKIDLQEKEKLETIIKKSNFDAVINLAAQAGVRYSIEHPQTYIDSNLLGFFNLLDACKKNNIEHFIFASSSSVYGLNNQKEFSVDDKTDCPVSLYAATKKSNELIAYSYSSLFNMKITGLRFFTVYGEFGRPDMAYFSFTKNILEGKDIYLFNNGNLQRDFTYIDDIVCGIKKCISKMPNYYKSLNASVPFKVLNLGNNKPIELIEFVKIIEKYCGKKANINLLPMQKGDVYKTCANIDDEEKIIGYKPKTSINMGLEKFIKWYKNYYK